MPKLIITENPNNWHIHLDGVTVVSPAEYISSDKYQTASNIKIINLCKSYQYQSAGYYVSLLSEARGHKVIPHISTVQDFRFPSLIREDAQDFDDLIQQTFKNEATENIEFCVHLGKTKYEPYNRLANTLFNLMQAPILKASFVKKSKWALQSLKPLSFPEIPPEDKPVLSAALENYFSGKNTLKKGYQRKKYDLAILVNPDELMPPSDAKAIRKFAKAAEKVGFGVDVITKNDFGKLIQYDALFIRETTNVNHHTFRFAKKAEADGLVVIDDPESILKCTNKVYLNELLTTNKILTPKSTIVQKESVKEDLKGFHFPFILKQPDSAFSKGVVKVKDEATLKRSLTDLFQTSDLLIAQEFLPTEFDWRVGILNNQPLYICKYFMARNHWQIVNWEKVEGREGKSTTIPLSEAPGQLIKTALNATRLIGDGLYGVDVKEANGKFYIIEINDNPSIDAGIEDKVEKENLYLRVMEIFMQRVKVY